jgi:hypothetical protein
MGFAPKIGVLIRDLFCAGNSSAADKATALAFPKMDTYYPAGT